MQDIYVYMVYTFATNIISAIKLAMAITFWTEIGGKMLLVSKQ